MKRAFVRVAALVAVLGVLVAALAVGIVHSVATHAATASAAYSEGCPPAQSMGSKSTWVQAVQFVLNADHVAHVVSFAHYPLATDGIFGANTKGAVVAYQNKLGITGGNGVVGTRTWASLGFCTGFDSVALSGDKWGGSACPGQLSSGSSGSSGTWVQALQQALNIDATATPGSTPIAKDYHNDKWWPLARDGKFGAKTADAVKSLQAANHLAQDGIAGKQTWGAMGFCY